MVFIPKSKLDDKKLDVIYEEMVEEKTEEQKKERSWINKIPMNIRLYGIIAVAIGIWYVITYKPKTLYIALGAGFIIFSVYILTQGDIEPRKLTDRETAISLQNKLRMMQKDGRLGTGKIIVSPEGVERWRSGKPWKREHGWKFIDKNRIPHMYSADMNVWDGELIGIKDRPTGFTGHEAPDIVTIPPKEWKWEAEKEKYIDRHKKRKG